MLIKETCKCQNCQVIRFNSMIFAVWFMKFDSISTDNLKNVQLNATWKYLLRNFLFIRWLIVSREIEIKIFVNNIEIRWLFVLFSVVAQSLHACKQMKKKTFLFNAIVWNRMCLCVRACNGVDCKVHSVNTLKLCFGFLSVLCFCRIWKCTICFYMLIVFTLLTNVIIT